MHAMKILMSEINKRIIAKACPSWKISKILRKLKKRYLIKLPFLS